MTTTQNYQKGIKAEAMNYTAANEILLNHNTSKVAKINEVVFV